MKWKLKALVQNLIAELPPSIANSVYYFLQRELGGLRRIDPRPRLAAGVSIVEQITAQHKTVSSKTFLEIGTGRRLNLPIAFWLCGASEIVTVDLNPYLKPELVFEDITFIKRNQSEVSALFGRHRDMPLFQRRFNRLLSTDTPNFEDLMAMLNTRYVAPADASCLNLDSHSIDYQVSYTVLEHIPPRALREIVEEGKRLLKKGGLMIHFIDPSDHFAHSDKSISTANFLQYEEEEWSHIAGNRYAYHNRLRIDDYTQLFEDAGLHILSMRSRVDERALWELRSGFRLQAHFKKKDPQINASVDVKMVAAVP